jgi:hypothetical protein
METIASEIKFGVENVGTHVVTCTGLARGVFPLVFFWRKCAEEETRVRRVSYTERAVTGKTHRHILDLIHDGCSGMPGPKLRHFQRSLVSVCSP